MAVGTTIFFAGAEVEKLTRSLLDNGVRNILYSYYYIYTMRRESFIRRMMDEYPEVNWFLDCGAFTFGVKHRADSAESAKLPSIRQYVRRYFAYIEDTGERWCRVTEPDMDLAGVPYREVYEWREEMFERWPHLNITPVWHTSRGIADWYECLDDPRIKSIAMGSGDILKNEGMTRRLVLDAAKVGVPVHGFGCTRVNTVLKRVPFDSVDSTTWLLGQRTGVVFLFRANKFSHIEGGFKEDRRLYKRYFRNIGCDVKKVLQDDVDEVRKANVIAWRALGDRLETMKLRGRQTHGVANGVFTVRPKRDAEPYSDAAGVVPMPGMREPGCGFEGKAIIERDRPPVFQAGSRGDAPLAVMEARTPANLPAARGEPSPFVPPTGPPRVVMGVSEMFGGERRREVRNAGGVYSKETRDADKEE